MSICNHSLVHRAHCTFLKLTQFVIKFFIELSLIDTVLHPKKVKSHLGVETELRLKKVRGLIYVVGPDDIIGFCQHQLV